MNTLLKSKAFWTALLSVIAVLVMRYTAIPDEVWQSIAALLLVIVGLFTKDELENGIARELRITVAEIRKELRELRLLLRK